jgi:sugar lactone lactonase YvrE
MEHQHREVVVPHIAKLGEGPVWNVHEHSIMWLDILSSRIHTFYPLEQKHKVLQLDQMPGAIALRKNGGIIAALQNGFGYVDPESGAVTLLADPESKLPGNRFNDGKCDPAGRFWAGSMSLSEEKGAGSLYTLDKDHSVSLKIKDVTISNGLAWSPDHKTLYYIDTPTSQIVAYDYDINTGQIANGKVVINVSSEDGYPDGMTIDTEGKLWVAHWAGWQVIRYDPGTGDILTRIKLPVANVTCCTFGGGNLDDLYITTASKDISAEELKGQPLAGSLFVVKNCGYKGFLPFEFG